MAMIWLNMFGASRIPEFRSREFIMGLLFDIRRSAAFLYLLVSHSACSIFKSKTKSIGREGHWGIKARYEHETGIKAEKGFFYAGIGKMNV